MKLLSKAQYQEVPLCTGFHGASPEIVQEADMVGAHLGPGAPRVAVVASLDFSLGERGLLLLARARAVSGLAGPACPCSRALSGLWVSRCCWPLVGSGVPGG